MRESRECGEKRRERERLKELDKSWKERVEGKEARGNKSWEVGRE